MKSVRTTLAVAVAVASALPLAAHAGSNFTTGAGAINTTVPLNFSVVIPRFVFLRVGNAAAGSNNTLLYTPSVTDIITPTAVTAAGGDVNGGTDLTVQVFGNAGNATLAASNLTQLISGGGDVIPTSTLTGTAQSGVIGVPAFNGSVALAASPAGVVNQAGVWRYSWTNPANTIYAAGTYTGTVTYTLSAP